MATMFRVSIHNVTTHEQAEGRGRTWDSATRNAMRTLGDRGYVLWGETIATDLRRVQSLSTDRRGNTYGGYVYTVTTLVSPESATA